MTNVTIAASTASHTHVFLSETHEKSERRTWAVIWLCGAMMILEIVGGLFFGSIALVADGLHMSTHAGALLLAALAYTYARKHARNPRFTFGTGKFGDLAGFSSAIILAMIAVLIGYEAISRLFAPVAIEFGEALPIAALGLLVNVASAWLLSGGDHGLSHGHGHAHGHGAHEEEHGPDEHGHDERHRLTTSAGAMELEIFEDGVPPRFRLQAVDGAIDPHILVAIETVRPDGMRQTFAMITSRDHLESVDEIPEPHAFTANVRIGSESQPVVFEEREHDHGASSVHRDNNMRAAVIHVVADAAVSVLVIVGLVLAYAFHWNWMDPLAGIVGALVIASWSYGLIRDTGAILLDVNPEPELADRVRRTLQADGDQVFDLHLWRLGPGHLGAIASIATAHNRDADFYRHMLSGFRSLSHLTVEVARR